MVTRTEYLRGMLEQALESHGAILRLQDRPGDLPVMRQELLRIKGIMQVVVNKIDPKDHPSTDIAGLSARAASFLEDYYFEREINLMEPLYGDDPGRLKHMRYKVLEALENEGLTTKIREILADL